MTTATARKAKSEETTKQYFQGKIGREDFKADFIEHEWKNNFWLTEGAMKIPPGETSRQRVIFKYHSEDLPSGRYSIPDTQSPSRYSVILMTVNDTPVPAYQAHRGTIEFFHDPNGNTVEGALNVYLKDIDDNEINMQILFNTKNTSDES
ncbi:MULTISPECIES: hypothetical protein [unclassified Pseudomonas]|uniref:hypothetical protein n=1 Tax=unclassified Pseudomonas TaxID=196821 RepID=UPI0008123FF9|nr:MULTISPECIES: hypothetical protein [unclassified Pseudomonas]TKJ77860.1 hypothetical protein PspCFBP13509_17865 [Pseudomonas sp. CFBP13509]SAM35329.1 hypothetical protein BN1864_LIB5394:05376 [Pseudomonas sp. 1 R 17]